MINFKANFLHNTNVQRVYPDKSLHDYKVSLVELEPVSNNDEKMLKNVSALWGGPSDSFASDILDDFRDIYAIRDYDKRFFALTEQRRNFNKLDYFDILGLMEVARYDTKAYRLNYLQVSPEFDYFVPERQIKHIGQAMVSSLKKIFAGKDIFLDSVLSAVKFYEKQGFKNINANTMVFRAKI